MKKDYSYLDGKKIKEKITLIMSDEKRLFLLRLEKESNKK
jgi:hypothetical protein